MLVKFTLFNGEIPILPEHLLPDVNASYASECEFSHGELRGRRDELLFANLSPIGGAPIRSVWTEDGVNFFGWPWETDVVKSQVVNDQYRRIYYTGMPDAPIIKVARTHRNDNGVFSPVIASDAILGDGSYGSGNYKPPEMSNVGAGGNNTGPDSWYLGIDPPQVQGSSDNDKLQVTLRDAAAWPDIPLMRLRVTFFLELASGEIVFQLDISNNEAAVSPVNYQTYGNVFYTNNSDDRGNKVQDMLWPLKVFPEGSSAYVTGRPYKYYWCDPPPYSMVSASRVVNVINSYAGDIVVKFEGSPEPAPPWVEQIVEQNLGGGDSSNGGAGGGDGGDSGDSA
jgi:hypothetical protein